MMSPVFTSGKLRLMFNHLNKVNAILIFIDFLRLENSWKNLWWKKPNVEKWLKPSTYPVSWVYRSINYFILIFLTFIFFRNVHFGFNRHSRIWDWDQHLQRSWQHLQEDGPHDGSKHVYITINLFKARSSGYTTKLETFKFIVSAFSPTPIKKLLKAGVFPKGTIGKYPRSVHLKLDYIQSFSLTLWSKPWRTERRPEREEMIS